MDEKETGQQCCLLRALRLSWKLIQSGNWIFMFENIHNPEGCIRYEEREEEYWKIFLQ